MNALEIVKYPVRVLRDKARSLGAAALTRRRINKTASDFATFDPSDFRRRVLDFLARMRCDDTTASYRYSAGVTEPTLYGSAYACMTLSLLDQIRSYSSDEKAQWIAHFDSYQSEQDGLFYDPVIDSTLFRTFDWWGARHLALHMVSAYTALGGRPKYPFRFVEEYYDIGRIKDWLDAFNWNGPLTYTDDIDNKIMNVGCILQYQRDAWNDERAAAAVTYLREYLAQRIDPETGMWGPSDIRQSLQRSRVVQFAYHLFPIYFYDSIPIGWPDKVLQHVLATQNDLGGFGVCANSSACEDIDSIDLLVRLAPLVPERKADIDAALRKAFSWVLCNQVADGGFVFRLYEPLIYGHRQMVSGKNQGALFPTWFRTLTLAYLARHFAIDGFHITRAPGLEQ